MPAIFLRNFGKDSKDGRKEEPLIIFILYGISYIKVIMNKLCTQLSIYHTMFILKKIQKIGEISPAYHEVGSYSSSGQHSPIILVLKYTPLSVQIPVEAHGDKKEVIRSLILVLYARPILLLNSIKIAKRRPFNVAFGCWGVQCYR